MTRLNPSIDEMANDARRLGDDRAEWRSLFRRMLAAYGYRVVREGGAILDRGRVALQGWEIVR